MRVDAYKLRNGKTQQFAFTLVELITVIGLIALFSGVVGYAFLRGGQQTIGLQTAQGAIAHLVALARSQAALSGREAGVFVSVATDNVDRYLRYINAAYQTEHGEWKSLTPGVYLPANCYVLPKVLDSSMVEGENLSNWTRLESTALDRTWFEAFNSRNSEDWIAVIFSPQGNTSAGRIVVANGIPTGSSPPLRFGHPENVRGVTISRYGHVRLVNEPAGFQ